MIISELIKKSVLWSDTMSNEAAPRRFQADEAVLGLNLEPLHRQYRLMKLIRQMEERLLDMFGRNELFGTTHTCMGQEADAVGVLDAIDRSKDTVWSNHRCHGHFLAYCGLLEGLVAEIMGRTTGVCGGRGGSQHLCAGRFHSSGIQGGFAPIAVGTALAGREEGAISVAFLGDGTMGEGMVYEALNLASVWSAPVLFVVEDNGIAQTTPSHLTVSGDIASRAKPFGLRVESIESTDVRRISALATEAVSQVRQGGKPLWLAIKTVRLGPHSKGDDTRSPEELEAARRLDPIRLISPLLPAERIAHIDQECSDLVEAAISSAKKAPVACAS